MFVLTNMQTSSLSSLKKELQTLPQEQLVELCTRLAKYKKENKELLNYILFESSDEELYIQGIKEEVETLFAELPSRNFHLAKKGLRKTLRLVNKYIKYSGKPTTTIELLMHFCKQFKKLGRDFESSTALINLYDNQWKKINKAIDSLHEDLQYDYRREMEGEISNKQ